MFPGISSGLRKESRESEAGLSNRFEIWPNFYLAFLRDAGYNIVEIRPKIFDDLLVASSPEGGKKMVIMTVVPIP